MIVVAAHHIMVCRACLDEGRLVTDSVRLWAVPLYAQSSTLSQVPLCPACSKTSQAFEGADRFE